MTDNTIDHKNDRQYNDQKKDRQYNDQKKTVRQYNDQFGLSQDNASEWSDMSTNGDCLVQSIHHHHLLENNLLSP